MHHYPPPPPPPAYDTHQIEANGRYAKPMETSSKFLMCMNVINLLTHFFFGCIMISAFYYVFYVKSLSNFSRYWLNFHEHVYLCMIGYFILMCHAILEFNPYVGWGVYLQEPQKRITSIIMHFFGSGLAVTGSMMKYFDWTIRFSSLHAYFGFIAMILTIFSFCGAIINFILSQSKTRAFELGFACLTAVTMTTAFLAIIAVFHNNFFFYGPASGLSVAFTVFSMAGLLCLIFSKYVRIKISQVY